MLYRSTRRIAGLVVAAICLVACGDRGATGPSTVDPMSSPLGQAALNASSTPSPGQQPRFLVIVDDGADPVSVAASHGVRPLHVFTRTVRGFAGSVSEAARAGLLKDGRVRLLERDVEVHASDLQVGPGWGLDRIDQRSRNFDGSYSYDRTGAGTTVYIVDTGVRTTHQDFQGRAFSGYDALGGDGSDCNGHGTHVAATAAGAQYGVAKQATVVSVRVLDCGGNGAASGVIAGLEWIADRHPAGEPAVVNLSLGGSPSVVLDQAVERLVGAGLLVVVAAGNQGGNACGHSPGRVSDALTVGATDFSDQRADFSNYGDCVDLFAPGRGIQSAHYSTDDAALALSGTSMAAPHASGVALMFLESEPWLDPVALRNAVWEASTKDVVSDARSANAHMVFAPREGDDGEPPPPVLSAPTGLAAVAGTIVPEIAVAWDSPMAGATEVELSWRSTDGEWFSRVRPASETSFTLANLPNGTAYEFRIRALEAFSDAWRASDWSPVATAQTCEGKGRRASAKCATSGGRGGSGKGKPR